MGADRDYAAWAELDASTPRRPPGTRTAPARPKLLRVSDVADQASIEQLRRIHAISDAALAHLDLEALLDELLVRIRDALDAVMAAFLLLDERTNDLVVRAVSGTAEPVASDARLGLGEGLAGRVAAERRTIAADALEPDALFITTSGEKGVRSALGAPLVAFGRVIGVVVVATLTHRVFGEEDADLLGLAADRAALAIDHGRAYEAERSLGERLQHLQAVTDVALRHLSIADLLDELVVRVREILAADTCAILLLDEMSGELIPRAAAGLEEEVDAGVRIPLGRGFAGRIAAQARPVFLEHVDHRNVLNPILRQKGIASLLGAPLLARGRVLGVIHVGSLQRRIFTREETELLETAAERAALGLERALLYERLIELDRVRDRFIAVASHELRTPATAILGSAMTLEARQGSLAPEQEAGLRRVLAEQARRLTTLLEQLLDLSRLGAHSVEIRPERHRVRELVQHALGVIAPEQRTHVDVAVDPALEVHADPVAFERIVSNLVSNALRHGAPPVVITAASDEPGDGVRIVVEDGGGGVPVDVQARLFDEFARSARAAGTPGTGLGLAIARSYAQAHGGDLVLEENGNRGARFRLVLPAA